MPSRLRPPGFEDFSLTLGSTSWIHSSRWEEAHFLWYHQQRIRSSGFSQIDRPPPVFHRKFNALARSEGSWLLQKATDGEVLAWADLHIQTRARYRVGLLFYDDRFISDDEFGWEALATLVSAIFLIGKLDQVRLIERRPIVGLRRAPEGLAVRGTLYSLSLIAWHPDNSSPEALSVCDFSRFGWNEYAAQQAFRKNFKHIEGRLDRYEKSALNLGSRKRKRGLIARILRPRIEDSLF